jgi:hypothetical protein
VTWRGTDRVEILGLFEQVFDHSLAVVLQLFSGQICQNGFIFLEKVLNPLIEIERIMGVALNDDS